MCGGGMLVQRGCVLNRRLSTHPAVARCGRCECIRKWHPVLALWRDGRGAGTHARAHLSNTAAPRAIPVPWAPLRVLRQVNQRLQRGATPTGSAHRHAVAHASHGHKPHARATDTTTSKGGGDRGRRKGRGS
jgi:hypothetical protein